MQVRQALERFLIQLQADGRGGSICAQYQRHVRCFDAWLARNRYKRDVAGLSHERVAEFLASPAARVRPDGQPKLATSVNVLRGSLKNFFRYCHLAGLTDSDVGRLIRRAHCSTAPPRWLSPDECTQLLRTLKAERGAIARRDAMFVQLLLGTGVRLGTALALTDADVDLPRRLLALREMKGDRPDLLVISAGIAKALRAYLRGRSPGALFDNGAGRPLGRRQAATRLALWGERAELPQRLTAHSLRHTFARRLYERTGDVLVVKELLRHKSVASTLIYASVDGRDLRRALG